MKFKELPLSEPILKAIEKKGYETPTAIQQKAIPEVLNGHDILGIAQTGTGKTAAFAIPIIQIAAEIRESESGKPKIKALILTPTRELAHQIDENIRSYNSFTHLKHTVIYGGVKFGKQINMLKKGVDILVATPGRLLDLIRQGYVNLKNIEVFVLDEADQMLDMGFIHDINKVSSMLPKDRQTLFFSATMPDKIFALSSKILTDPIRVEIKAQSTAAETVTQYLYQTDKNKKVQLLNFIIDELDVDQALIFTRTKRGAEELSKTLNKLDLRAGAIHGDKSQAQRQRTLNAFKAKKIDFLTATDVASRGIDISKLSYVINYDIPNDPETYIHRIGRSGRAGEKGMAISICEHTEKGYVKAIEKLLKKPIDLVEEHPYPQTPRKEKEGGNRSRGGRKPRRKYGRPSGGGNREGVNKEGQSRGNSSRKSYGSKEKSGNSSEGTKRKKYSSSAFKRRKGRGNAKTEG